MKRRKSQANLMKTIGQQLEKRLLRWIHDGEGEISRLREREYGGSLTSAAGDDNPYAAILNFRNKRTAELGTSCGVAGMGISLLGLTDIATVMPALKRNLKVGLGVNGGAEA